MLFSLFYCILSLFFGVGGGGDGVSGKLSKHIDLNINLIFF